MTNCRIHQRDIWRTDSSTLATPCSQSDMGKDDVTDGKWTSPSQVDNDLLMFHWVGGCTERYGVLNALTDVEHQTTAPVLSCTAAISIPMRRVEARH